MAFYIYLDDLGKELKREEKGRGKPKSGFEKREDGNFYGKEVIKDFIPDFDKPKSEQPKSTDTESQEKPLEASVSDSDSEKVLEDHIHRIKHYKPKKKINLNVFLTAIHTSSGDRHDSKDGKVIILDRTYIQGGFSEFPHLIEGIAFPGSYARIIVDLNIKQVKVWGMVTTGDPIAVIEDPFF